MAYTTALLYKTFVLFVENIVYSWLYKSDYLNMKFTEKINENLLWI